MPDNPIPPTGADDAGGSVGARTAGRLVLLSSAMRAGGAPVGVGALLAAHRALMAVDSSDRAECYFALRGALCSGVTDHEVFDAAFCEVFRAVRATPVGAEVHLPPSPERTVLRALRAKQFTDYTASDVALARRCLRALALRRPGSDARPSRWDRRGAEMRTPRVARPVPTSRSGERHWTSAASRPRSLVIVADADLELRPYLRPLLAYAEACLVARRRVEVFVGSGPQACITGGLRDAGAEVALSLLPAPTVAGAAAAALADPGLADLTRGAHLLVLTWAGVGSLDQTHEQAVCDAARVVVLDPSVVADLGSLERRLVGLEHAR